MEFTIWKNKFKKEDKHPDYRINQKNEKGEWVEIGAAWKKTVKGKVDEKGQPVTYLSCKLKEEVKQEVKIEEIPADDFFNYPTESNDVAF